MVEYCDECGEQEAIDGEHCGDCLILLAEAYDAEEYEEHLGWGLMDDTPSLCFCEDRPCCGCGS